MQKSTLPNFGISIFEKLGFGIIRNRYLKTWNSISILNFGNAKLKIYLQNSKICTWKFDIRFRLWILGPEIWFSKFQNRISNFFRISIRDHQIWNRRPRKPRNLDFRFKINFRFKFFFNLNIGFVLGLTEFKGVNGTHAGIRKVLQIPMILGTFFFCFCPADTITTIKKEMKNPRDLKKSLFIAHVFTAVVYLLAGGFCYLGFGDYLSGNGWRKMS